MPFKGRLVKFINEQMSRLTASRKKKKHFISKLDVHHINLVGRLLANWDLVYEQPNITG